MFFFASLYEGAFVSYNVWPPPSSEVYVPSNDMLVPAAGDIDKSGKDCLVVAVPGSGLCYWNLECAATGDRAAARIESILPCSLGRGRRRDPRNRTARRRISVPVFRFRYAREGLAEEARRGDSGARSIVAPGASRHRGHKRRRRAGDRIPCFGGSARVRFLRAGDRRMASFRRRRRGRFGRSSQR